MKTIQRKSLVKLAVMIIAIIAAFVFFGDFGEKDEILIETEIKEGAEAATKEEKPNELYVDISGQVKTPGVYKVNEGTRLFQLIKLAGGLKSNADMNSFNQAELITDEQKVVIPKRGEADHETGLININDADSNTLQQIPGVGPATAEKIINHRDENGRFKSIEEIKSVNGIGEKTYLKMKDLITA